MCAATEPPAEKDGDATDKPKSDAEERVVVFPGVNIQRVARMIKGLDRKGPKPPEPQDET